MNVINLSAAGRIAARNAGRIYMIVMSKIKEAALRRGHCPAGIPGGGGCQDIRTSADGGFRKHHAGIFPKCAGVMSEAATR